MNAFDLVMSAVTSEAEFECPHCGEEHQVYPDYAEELMTVHGDEGSVEIECCECGEPFYVQELLTRKFCVTKTRDDL